MNASSASTVNEQVNQESPGLLEVLRRFPRPVWMIFFGMFINRFGTFVLPFLGLHMTREGYTAGETSLSMGAYGLGHLLATLIGGHLADAFGRRNTIVLSMFSGAVSLLALSQAATLPSFVGLAFCVGLTSELYRPASSALLSDLIPERDRVTAFAVYRFAINAGWAFGPATAGFLSEHSYFWLFFGDAMTTAAYGLIALYGLPSGLRSRRANRVSAAGPLESLLEGFRAALSDRRFVRLLIANAFIAFVFMQMMTTFGLEVKANGHPERVYGLILGLNGVIIVLCEIPLTAYTQRCRPLTVMAVGNLFVALGVGVVAWAGSIVNYSIAMVIFTVGEMIGMPVALAYVSRLAPESMRGRYLGIYGLTWASAICLGPSLGMLFFSRNPFGFWLACGLVGLLSVAVLLWPVRENGTQS